MCGRYSLISSLNEIKERFQIKKISGNFLPNNNASPSQQLPLIANTDPERIVLAEWGIIPAWMKDEKSPKRLINAKAETIDIKPTFKNAAEKRRCIIIADGFYEWAQIPGQKKKQPFFITLKNDSPFAMAGIYEIKNNHLEFAIITVAANSLMAKIHNRMPAILLPADEKRWLNPNISLQQAIKMLKAYPANKMQAVPLNGVSQKRQINELPRLF